MTTMQTILFIALLLVAQVFLIKFMIQVGRPEKPELVPVKEVVIYLNDGGA